MALVSLFLGVKFMMDLIALSAFTFVAASAMLASVFWALLVY